MFDTCLVFSPSQCLLWRAHLDQHSVCSRAEAGDEEEDAADAPTGSAPAGRRWSCWPTSPASSWSPHAVILLYGLRTLRCINQACCDWCS